MPKPQQSTLISSGALCQFQVIILPLARATSQLTREDIRQDAELGPGPVWSGSVWKEVCTASDLLVTTRPPKWQSHLLDH